MDIARNSSKNLADAITLAASKQTYYTFRLLCDKDRLQQGFQAYAYFRWVDDRLDEDLGARAERLSFIARQQSLLTTLTAHGKAGCSLSSEETMLAELIASDPAPSSGLRSYLGNMMQVMAFDTKRRGRLVLQAELDAYTHYLAVAVTELLHYVIGHGRYAPQDETRYAAASAAHIAHMLRDTGEDVEAGYFNVPREVLQGAGIGAGDVDHPAYRAWVRERVDWAKAQFRIGRDYLSRVESLRCRFAGHTYMSRFKWVLAMIERDDYLLRPQYPSRKTFNSVLNFAGSVLGSLFTAWIRQPGPVRIPVAEPRKNL